MKKDFYEKLAKVIAECEAHPYKFSRPFNFGDGWEGRISKENLGVWSDEDYDTLFNHSDERVEEMCEKSSLDCFVICGEGGYMYLCFY